MTPNDTREWLLLIHQIPPEPNALRVKIWRRLQQVGAVAIKQSVYAMPLSEQSREDLSWILREIVEGGGDGSISEVRFVEGLTDEQVIALFQGARKADYEKIIREAGQLLNELSSGPGVSQNPAGKVMKVKRRLDEVMSIDFFQAQERDTARILIQDLTAHVSGSKSAATAGTEEIDNLKGKIWLTRQNLFVDRIACGWLIRRLVDSEAVFKFVRGPRYVPRPGELRFDMFDGEFTHEGDRCTFEVMIQRLHLQDQALVPMAEVVHDIDLKDDKYGRCETAGFNALLTGLIASFADDEQRMEEGLRLFENLYAYFQRRKEPAVGLDRKGECP